MTVDPCILCATTERYALFDAAFTCHNVVFVRQLLQTQEESPKRIINKSNTRNCEGQRSDQHPSFFCLWKMFLILKEMPSKCRNPRGAAPS